MRSKSLISIGVASRCFIVTFLPSTERQYSAGVVFLHVNPKFPGSLLVDVVQAGVNNPAVPTNCYRLSGNILLFFRPDFHQNRDLSFDQVLP